MCLGNVSSSCGVYMCWCVVFYCLVYLRGVLWLWWCVLLWSLVIMYCSVMVSRFVLMFAVHLMLLNVGCFLSLWVCLCGVCDIYCVFVCCVMRVAWGVLGVVVFLFHAGLCFVVWLLIFPISQEARKTRPTSGWTLSSKRRGANRVYLPPAPREGGPIIIVSVLLSFL